HTFDRDIVDQPAVATAEHPVVDRDLDALLGDDSGPHRRQIAVDRIAEHGDLLAVVGGNSREVSTVEEVAEEYGELRALGVCEPRPVRPEGPACHLAEVEGLFGD